MLFHNPVILARRFATLDVMSQGRAICGLGIGCTFCISFL
jgi:alkanesulfonate monooxygenase SsuD/methylene tetrahydromethanopterin reductase-like flavin-dependent oxidoreductase (luciferase family)